MVLLIQLNGLFRGHLLIVESLAGPMHQDVGTS